MPFPEGILLGDYSPREKRELMRRHKAAMTVIRQLATAEERIELLMAVVSPSEKMRETVRELDADFRED